jgi:hypothetical protein
MVAAETGEFAEDEAYRTNTMKLIGRISGTGGST